MIFVNSNNYKL